MKQNLPNQDPGRYAEEGYCVFYDHLSSDEMQPYQQTLDGMLARMRPGEKPQLCLNRTLAVVTGVSGSV